jgi:DedD protein
MDEQTRYRVTGSLFLLAIAVIVFPMLFDGAGLEPLDIEPLDVPKNVPDVSSRESMAPASDFVDRVDALRESVDEGGFQADAAGTRMGEPVLTEPDETTRVWAVQVASFGEEENALKLRDQLRSDQKEAFISTVRQDEATLRRVAVGPLLDLTEAEGLRDELATSLGLEDVRVVAFSN